MTRLLVSVIDMTRLLVSVIDMTRLLVSVIDMTRLLVSVIDITRLLVSVIDITRLLVSVIDMTRLLVSVIDITRLLVSVIDMTRLLLSVIDITRLLISPRSRFTRVQRVLCCAVMLFMTMLTNATWYGVINPLTAKSVKFGPFALGQEQFMVGLISNLIVLIPSILIISMFRYSRPFKKRESRIDKAINAGEDGPEGKRYIRITSLSISFFTSVLIVEPMQVLLFSLFLTCIYKQEPDDEDDSDQDEREPHLQYNETWLEHDTTNNREPKVYRPLTREGLYDLREKRRNEIQMWTSIKEIIIYTIYLILLIIIARGLRDPTAYYMRRSMQDSFIRPEAPIYAYRIVSDANRYWKWMHNVVFYKLVVQNWYNGEPPFLLRGYLDDRVNRLMGYGILRQVRSKPNTCRVADVFTIGKENFTCTGLATFIHEDDKDYCEYWKDPDTVMDYLKECQNKAFRYRTEEELDALPILSKPLDKYSGGGYVMEFRGRTDQLQEKLKELQRKRWIDQYTRGVFLEFCTYNVNVNLFGIAQISAEFVPGGGIHPSWRFDVIRLIDDRVLIRVCEILFACFTFYYTIRILRLLWKHQLK
ncbi:unnamed protein product, partial [Cyprideis torosa]